MSLNTFSAYLDFAIRLEESGLEHLRRYQQSGVPWAGTLVAEGEKTLKTLRTILRENVTELVMEPCEPLSEETYRCDPVPDDPAGGARRFLVAQRTFALDVARVINLKEVKRSFTRLADRKDQLLAGVPAAAR
ncbi:MAG: hypothetical protein GX442_14310 [Candidatus Riflebacteria bacterium]|nr:hypothetical protein [Candidatus Riflebacteria bacterium]